MKMLKPGTYKQAVCSWCRLPAAWRSGGLGINQYSCSRCRDKLRAYEQGRQSEHMSEADYQTWGKL